MPFWPTVRIQTEAGEQEALAPAIISASRATDIPAFHLDWLLERLRAGFALWHNPFNAAQSQYVSFSRCRLLVLWSKNPGPLLPRLPALDASGMAYYLQFTLNDYEAEGLEPHVPPLARRIETFCRLAEKLGPERIIWRFDPLLRTNNLSLPQLLERLDALGRRLSPYTHKLVFSFLDMYAKIRAPLARHPLQPRPLLETEMLELAQGIASCNSSWPHPLQLATCAEYLDLSPLGIAHNACIDPDLAARLCPHDAVMARLCGTDRKPEAPQTPGPQQGCLPLLEPAATATTDPAEAQSRQHSRDPSRRRHCQCLPAKDIGAYSTCPHGCLYCYANQSAEAVRRRLAARRAGQASLA